MILYFANRQMEILGHATTNMRSGFVINDDLKTETVETGVEIFDCKIGYRKSNKKCLKEMTKTGNYILRENDGENEFYTIIDREIDSKNQEIYIYAESGGLDLINEIAEAFKATEAHTAEWYLNKWIIDSGFEIGINEITEDYERTLEWEGESTVTERIASIATQFGGYEVSFSFAVKGMEIIKKYVNIHKERGKNTEEELRLNKELDRIIIKESIADLATAFVCIGGIPEGSEEAITLKGYEYDDGDFYVDEDGVLKSRNAVAKWSRYVWNKEPNKLNGYFGHITRTYSYDTLSQSTLCQHAVTQLKKVCDTEINYEIDIARLPENIKIGDRVNIIDDEGELYLSSRILSLETSVSRDVQTATIGEHLVKEGGIAVKVEEMALKLASISKSAAQANIIASTAKTSAEAAKTTADEAKSESEKALMRTNEAVAAAAQAGITAGSAQAKAEEAKAVVEIVKENISSLEVDITKTQETAENARKEAGTASSKAEEAIGAAQNAQRDAENANVKAEEAVASAEGANTKASNAQTAAEEAKKNAGYAQSTAEKARSDAEQAKQEILNLDEELESVSQTMSVNYVRTTELTETEAKIQTQITQNANGISSIAQRVVTIDETANNAIEQASQAQQAAQAAREQAKKAIADAEAAQKDADEAQMEAEGARTEANAAKAAASAAQGAADKAAENLAVAEAELTKVKSDVNSTKEQIEAAETAVTTAQATAKKAGEDAANAAQVAAEAQTKADTASQNAMAAQITANSAASQAASAQEIAKEAQGDVTEAVNAANEANKTAQAAQIAANSARENAAMAQVRADEAATEAATAQKSADEAEAKAEQAAADLATAERNLAGVTSRVDATEAEIKEAQEAVVTAQIKANDAAQAATNAQSIADVAKNNALTAQTAANNAQTAANNAQKAADEAQKAADAAQKDVNALAVRVAAAETKITQNSEQILLMATKTEVNKALDGYYTKSQTDAAITTRANSITSEVKATYTTKQEFDSLTIGGRNLYVGASKWRKDTPAATGASDDAYLYLSGTAYLEKGKVYTLQAVCELPWSTAHGSGVGAGKGTIWIASEDRKYHKVFTGDGTTTGRYTWTFTHEGATGNYNIRVNGYTKVTKFWDFKIESGNKATDWTPPPEDTASDIKSLSTAITQTDGKITTNAKSISDLGTRVSTVEQTASSLTVSLQTTNSNVSTAQSTANAAKTAAATAQSTADTAKTNAANAQSTANSAKSAADKAQTAADNAAKTATNFLSYDSSGLQIGNKSSGSWSGCRTQITSSAFNILNASGTVLASYGDKLVELGKNAPDAVIDLCGGKGKLGYGNVATAQCADGISYAFMESVSVALSSLKGKIRLLVGGASSGDYSKADFTEDNVIIESVSYKTSSSGTAVWDGAKVEISAKDKKVAITGALEVGGTRIASGAKENIIGTEKTATTVSNVLVLQGGAVFSGSAAAAGLVTRGICGVTTPDANGACSKDNLYINYDITNDYNAGRQLILQAGSAGTHYGNNLYQYAAARGDAVKGWVEAYNKDNYLPLSGGTLNGSLTGQYITGTWLRTIAATDLGGTPNKIAVLDSNGWLYYRTPAEIFVDIGVVDTEAVSIADASGTDYKSTTPINNSKLFKNTKQVFINAQAKIVLTNAIKAGTTIDLGQLPEYMPLSNCAIAIWQNSTQARRYMGFISRNGTISMKSNEDMPTGTYYIYFQTSYITE